MTENKKKIVNKIEDITDERAVGYAIANRDFVDYLSEYRAIVRKRINRDKVFILGCSGSGCEPLNIGYVGYGSLDAVCDGQVFTAPSAYSIFQLLQRYCNENGAVILSGNYDGDFMNNDMAIEMMSLEGKEVLSIYIRDDIGVSINDRSKRGGVAGIFFAAKILGAASELGYKLKDFQELKYKLENNLYTMTATLESGSFPGTGTLMGVVNDGEVEYGKGFNGEKGVLSEPLPSADEMTDTVLEYILKDMDLQKDEEVCVLVNGLGATSLMELYVIMKRVGNRMDEMNVKIHGSKVGNIHPVQETKGFSITLIRLDEELKRLYGFPMFTPYFSMINNEDLEKYVIEKYKK